MIVRRSMHDTYLSNAYLVADREGGTAVLVDSGAPVEPLLDAAQELGVRVTHLLNTHEHHDHTLNNIELQERFDIPVLGVEALADGEQLVTGDLEITALSTPGHTPTHLAFAVASPGGDTELVFTGDVLFAGTVGGTLGAGPEGYDLLRASIMDVLLALSDEVKVYPGHTDATTIGDERASNPFIRYWQGQEESLEEPVQVAGNPAMLVLWAPDYDGGHKALVRFDGDRLAIVGGSRVERTGAPA